MIIIQSSLESSVIDGTWGFTELFTPSSTGANYNFDHGIFNDELGSSSGKVWTFSPANAFLNREFSVVEEYNSGGVLLNRVTSNGASKIHKLDNTIGFGATRQKFHGFVPGSYGEFAANIILPMMGAEGSEIALFNESATRWNRNCWGNAFDLSGIVSRSSYPGGWTKERGGLLITKRHVFLANHYPIPTSNQVQFIKKGTTPELDEVITRTIIAGMRFPDRGSAFDSYLVLLDSDVPEGVNPFPLCGFSSRSPGLMCGKYSDLVIKTSSSKNVSGGSGFDVGLNPFVNSVGLGYGSTYTRTGLPEYVAEWIPFFANFATFIRPVLSGDSGSPHLQTLDATHLGVAAGSGTEAAHNEAIVAVDALAGISTGYTITVASSPI